MSKRTRDSPSAFSRSFAEFIGYLFITVLIWVFGVTVFIPLGSMIRTSPSTAPLIALIFLVAIALSGTRLLLAGKTAVDSFVDVSGGALNGRTVRPGVMRYSGYIGLTVLACLIFTPMAWAINPVLGGITLALVVLVIIILSMPLIGEYLTRTKRTTAGSAKRQS